MRRAMYPAICRGRALDSYRLAAVLLLSACASTGPGTPASLADIGAVQPRPGTEGMQPRPSTEGVKSRPNAGPVQPRPSTGAAQPRSPAGASRAAKPRATAPASKRVVVRDSAAVEKAVIKRLAHHPLAVVLARRMRNPELADRVAAAVVYEAGRARISPSV